MHIHMRGDCVPLLTGFSRQYGTVLYRNDIWAIFPYSLLATSKSRAGTLLYDASELVCPSQLLDDTSLPGAALERSGRVFRNQRVE